MYSTSLAEANVPNGRDGCKLSAALRPKGSGWFDYVSDDRRTSGSFSHLSQTGRNRVPVSLRSPSRCGPAASRELPNQVRHRTP